MIVNQVFDGFMGHTHNSQNFSYDDLLLSFSYLDFGLVTRIDFLLHQPASEMENPRQMTI